VSEWVGGSAEGVQRVCVGVVVGEWE